MIGEQIDDIDRIMAVMQAAFDPAYGEAWTRAQVSDALVLPNTHYMLAGADGSEPAETAPTVGFTLSQHYFVTPKGHSEPIFETWGLSGLNAGRSETTVRLTYQF